MVSVFMDYAPGDYINDADLWNEVEEAGFTAETEVLQSTITRSAYRLFVENDRGDLIAEIDIASEEITGTMIESISVFDESSVSFSLS